jgi:copper chaperone CopZ
MKKEIFKVKGMHCSSCEKLLTMEIGNLPGIKNVKANALKGIVEVEGNFDENKVKEIIVKCGYKV